MITGYDPSTRTLTTGIGNLIDFQRLPDTLVPSEHPLNVQKRQSIHNKFQRKMEKDGWLREVPLKLDIEVEGITFRIRGRLDLLFESETGIGILEVKTVTGDGIPSPSSDKFQRHALQLCFYVRALAQSREMPPDSITSHLVYVPVESGSIGRKDVQLDAFSREMEDAWMSLLRTTAVYILKEDVRREEQIQALEEFSFPFKTLRSGQRQMMDEVRRNISEAGFLMIQAPTGTGKTAAILSGALRETLPGRLTLFFLTAKNTHKAIVVETLERISEKGLKLRGIFLTAREKVCHRGRSSCFPDDCPFAQDFGKKASESDLINSILDLDIIEPDQLVKASRSAGVCAFEIGLCVSTMCDIVVCDYNYVFDPHVYLKRFFLERSTSSQCSLLIDEAANLPARARGYYSPELRLSWIRTILASADCSRDLSKLLEPWLAGFEEWLNLLRHDGRTEIELPVDTDLHLPVDRWIDAVIAWRDPPNELRDLTRSILDFSRISDSVDSRFHLLFRMEDGDSIIQWLCTDPSDFLSDQLNRCHSSTAFSATLKPHSHFRYLLGFPDCPETVFSEIPYPFPHDNLGVWMDRGIDTRYRSRERFADTLACRLRDIHSSVPGTWLVFFPSYSYMEMIIDRMDPSVPLLTQSRGMSTADRADFIGEIESGEHLVFTVSGGIFAEGIDLKSEQLNGAVVVGPSLPGMGLRQKLLAQRYEEQGKSGFIHTWAIPGMTRVIQAAGRLIRNGDQRKVLVLIGERFTRQPYIDLIPSHWFRDSSIPLIGRSFSELALHMDKKDGSA